MLFAFSTQSLKAFTGPKYYNLETSKSTKGEMDMSTATGGHVQHCDARLVVLERQSVTFLVPPRTFARE
jgi:hypothetical protein